ncbi:MULTISPECIES: hypothetical protein [Pseudoalteromonas]|uniref:Uncharacterized protein n=1 Tax=Pseudoalteromonas arctica A 37-1-2 TaxID=1117313 RepID=A0A290S966_9GAMM|nr:MULTISPECIES: hypothetical protein [Pseudoalteromonas]ATC88636.1 hypothetical protein PARC_b0436 [Pseudoalteromonas arctica A 37-1-2]
MKIEYDDRFSIEESDKLKSFENIIEKHWLLNSNSDTSLIWEIVVKSENPRLFALLKAQAGYKQVHLESCSSILKKSPETFQSEFVDAAIEFSRK